MNAAIKRVQIQILHTMKAKRISLLTDYKEWPEADKQENLIY